MFNTIKRFRIISSTFLTIIGTSIISVYVYRGFANEGFINFSQDIDLNTSALLGDFIGGFVGAIFTLVGVVLLYETLSLQRKELEESRLVFARQQFENKFFSLLELYDGIINTMHYDIPQSSKSYAGKEFFLMHKKDILALFNPTRSYKKNRKITISIYTSFYIKNSEYIAHYFRILYRIFRLIENSNFPEKEKINYAKIARAQLSDSELFFLNYNACTSQGKKFRELIIKYNLTKHLPLLERVEFKKWKEKLSNEKANSINILFDEILAFLQSNENQFYKTYLKGRFAFSITQNFNSIDFKIFRNNNQAYNDYIQEGYGLDDFNNQEIEELLKCWVLETFFSRNYNILNDSKNLSFKVDILNQETNKYKITGIVKTKDNTAIKIK